MPTVDEYRGALVQEVLRSLGSLSIDHISTLESAVAAELDRRGIVSATDSAVVERLSKAGAAIDAAQQMIDQAAGVLALVRDMRAAQKGFYKASGAGRDQLLQDAKRLEREVDQALAGLRPLIRK